MNHVFSLIWNPASQSYCPAPENARSRVKGRHRKLALALAIAAASSGVQAAPAGGNVVDGNALINTTGTATVINQTSDAVTINWLDFDIDANESVTFVQPDSNSLALNRVLTGNGTEIQGQLNANGRVFILDANGVLFGQNAQVNVGSLVASTLDLSSSDLANNHFEFSGNGSPAAVVNLGQITAANSGTVALLGGQVSNQGVIRAQLGNVALAAGNQITLDFAGDGLLNVQIDEGTVSALANNGGLIQADGGSVLMTAQASDALLQTVVNNTGVIEAHTLQEQDGKIMLLGGFNGGTVNVSGKLDASAPDGGNGGFIETSGAIVNINNDLTVTTAAVNGQTGDWLIDPTDLSISYVGANDGTSHLSTQALQNNLATTNVTVQTQAAGAQQGNITVVDPIIWASANRLTLDAHNNIAFNDYLHAPNGGLELDAGGTISTGAEGHINVAAFTLTDGDWSQVAATLPKFTADDFTLSGGTFTRATGGDGTGGSPLQIADIYGLQGLDTTPTLNAVLVNDIDASGTASWNAGAGFNPIGNTAATPYNASFNGQGHVISGLTINRPIEVYVGLFGYTGNTANIERTGLTDVSITGQFYVGGIAGRNSGAISNSFLTGTITGEAYVGGFSGVNYGTINNSYSTGAITGESFVGGLTGTNSGAINTSYVSGKVTLGGGAFSGGIISGANGGTVSNSYWDTFTTSQATSSGGSAINGNWAGAENAYNQATYAGFDFTNDWFIAEGSSRPMLRAFLDGGNISNLYQLQGMSADLAGAYTLIKNIDASATAASVSAGNGGNYSDVWGGRGFAPVGTNANPFTGSLDGQDFVIDDLTINRPDQSWVGLFGRTSAANLTQIGLTQVDITGNSAVGALVGQAVAGTISGSYSTGQVMGNSSGVGGLVGDLTGSINTSFSDASVSVAAQYGGGLVGYSTGDIDNSYATGSVSGGNGVGGLVGSLDFGGTITHSFASGKVAGTATTGGLVGTSGISTITQSYWDSFTTEQATSAGGGTAVNGNWAGAETAYNQASYAGFNFGTTWFIAEGSSRPMLRAFLDGGNIGNLYQLQGMAANLAGNYTLTTNIDAAATATSIASGNFADVWGGRGFAPVGNLAGAFTGSFNGNGFTISNLDIARGDQDAVGLFGSTGAAASIQNARLNAVDILGNNSVGGLVGTNQGSISSSAVSGDVEANITDAGGLAGVSSGSISGSYADVDVTSAGVSGGLAGYVTGSINTSYALGDAVGTGRTGGLVGHLNGVSATINQSYALGAASGSAAIGGLAGDASGGSTITNSFWNSSLNALATAMGTPPSATGLTTAQFGNIANFASWGASINNTGGGGSVWRLYEGHNSPLLRSFLTPITVTAYNDTKTFDGNAYAGLHNINGTIGNGVRYGTNYAQFLAAFGDNGTPYSGADKLGSTSLKYAGNSQGASNAGSYSLTPTDLWSTQQAFDIITNSGTLTIDPASVNISLNVDNASKIYGDADPSFSWRITSGSLFGSDALSGTFSRDAGENVGNYTIYGTPTGDLTNGNYVVTVNNGVFTINPRALEITVSDANKIYGELDPTFNWAITGGAMAFDETATANLSRVAGENVGSYSITATGTGSLNSNYSLIIKDGALNITPRTIVIDIAELEKIYGNQDPEFIWGVSSGNLVGNDRLSGVFSRTAGENVGTYQISAQPDGDLANGNYDYTINNGLLTINPRPLVLTADSLMKIYGAEDPALTWRISSGTLVEGDNLLVNISRADGSNVGTYAITLDAKGDATNSNYALTMVDGQLQITPAPLTVTANDVTSYWDLMPAFTASVEGLVNGDTEASVFGDSIQVQSNLTLPLPGNYSLTPTASQIGKNYQLNYVDGLLQLLSSNPGGNYIEALTSTQLPAREALGRELRANIYEGRPLLDGSEDGIVLQVLDGGVKLDPDTLAAWGIEFPQAVLFPTNSANVGQHYLAELRKFVAQLQRYPEVQVLVEGHSSSTGSLALNQRLSNERAKSVAQVLNSLGLEADRIRTENLDYQFPVASNLTEEGRLKNQRAVVVEDSITQ